MVSAQPWSAAADDVQYSFNEDKAVVGKIIDFLVVDIIMNLSLI